MITKQTIQQHGLSDKEYQKILDILGREPNLVELGIFSVMWSEHCSYKSSRLHLKKFPTKGVQVIQGPGENAGVVDIGDGWGIAFKMESHNHPSYIEPYQGAATGVGGILRDVFTMGARPIANLNSLRFGDVKHPKTARLVSGVVAGIAGYGNCVGVPTVGGEVFFDESYNGNILVNAMTLGLIRNDRIFKGVAEGVGNPVLYVGSKTGRDGIHGATMASAEFDDKSEEKRPTVQVGDPFIEKLLIEACLEVMQHDYLVGIQDMGAAGLTSSSFEMASRAGSGIEMHLDQVPMRETGMTAYELMLSESQERMLMVAKKGCEDKVMAIVKKWDLDAAVVGSVTDTGNMVLKMHDETVASLPIEPLVAAAPVYDRPIAKPQDREKLLWKDEKILLEFKSPQNLQETFFKMLSSPNLCSRKWVYQQYDHMVMTNTVVLPGSDAGVLRIKGLKQGIAVTADCNSRYCYLNPYEGAKAAIAEAARNLVCSGATPLAITDCLNFASPERPETMWEFSECIKGLSEACVFFNTPVVSGNVSFYNETSGTGVFPTPTIGMVGIIPDLQKHLSIAFKQAGDEILLIGYPKYHLGGSEYLKVVHGKTLGDIAPVVLNEEKQLQQVLLNLIDQQLLVSAHDLSDGGLLTALAESCLQSKNLGADLHVENKLRYDKILWGEGGAAAIVSCQPGCLTKVEALLQNQGMPYQKLGKVQQDRFKLNDIIDCSFVEMKSIWSHGFEKEIFVCAE